MHLLFLVATIAGSAVIAAGCSGAAGPGGEPRPTTAFDIRTAPLTLPGVGFVCYDFRVRNGRGETVVERGVPGVPFHHPNPTLTRDETSVCSGQFGNDTGGDIAYVAPCDAFTSIDFPSNNIHTVTVWIDGLYSGSQAAPTGVLEYLDPCPTGCTLPATCTENTDTPVTFNLTVMRPADQGFFDVAVNFDNIFCSAKLDCTYAGETDPITLLHNPNKDGQPRDTTFVVGLACTGGENSNTHLYMNPGQLVCYSATALKGVRVAFATTGVEDGNVGNVAGSTTVTSHDLVPSATGFGWSAPTGETVPAFLFQHAYYRGIESLGNVNKVYSNAAYGIDYVLLGTYFGTTAPSDMTCTYMNHATASDGPMSTASNMFYPQIQFCAEVFSNGNECLQNPLNAPDAAPITDPTDLDGSIRGGVFTTYSSPFGAELGTTCGPDINPPYELCITPDGTLSNDLVACDPIEGNPSIVVVDEPRRDVAHGYFDCNETVGQRVTFTLASGYAYCRSGSLDDYENDGPAWTPCANPATANGETLNTFVLYEPGAGNYGTHRVEIAVTDGAEPAPGIPAAWSQAYYLHESLENECFCDQVPEWPTDEEFFAVALAPFSRDDYNWWVSERGGDTAYNWELPGPDGNGGALDTSTGFTATPQASYHPIHTLDFENMAIVGVPVNQALWDTVADQNNEGVSMSFNYGTCSQSPFTSCTSNLDCELLAGTSGPTCDNVSGDPFYRKILPTNNTWFETLVDPAPALGDFGSVSGIYTYGQVRPVPTYQGLPFLTWWGAYDGNGDGDTLDAGERRSRETVNVEFDIVSLRKRFVFKTESDGKRSALLFYRSHRSRNAARAGETECRMTSAFGFYESRAENISLDAIVFTRTGEGVGLVVDQNGVPRPVVYSKRMASRTLLKGNLGRKRSGRHVISRKLIDFDREWGTIWQSDATFADATWQGNGAYDPGAEPAGYNLGWFLPRLHIWE